MLKQTHSYTADSIARGETLLGIDALFEAVVDRLDALMLTMALAIASLLLWKIRP
jgi:hypothetical protein